MLVGTIQRILHDANIHRLINRYTNRLSCFVVDDARRTFKEDIVRVLENIELAERLQRVVAGGPPPPGGHLAPRPRAHPPLRLRSSLSIPRGASADWREPVRLVHAW